MWVLTQLIDAIGAMRIDHLNVDASIADSSNVVNSAKYCCSSLGALACDWPADLLSSPMVLLD